MQGLSPSYSGVYPATGFGGNRICSVAEVKADQSYRYDPNTLYDGLVRSLFSKFHRLADHYYLAVAKRGQKDRNAALEHAEQDFERIFGFRRGGKWAITVCNPVTTICLQAVDYFLWAVQRFYEVRRRPESGEELPREDRFLKMLWPQIIEIHDLDFGRSTGTYFNVQRPFTIATPLSTHQEKEKSVSIGAQRLSRHEADFHSRVV